MEDKKIAVCVIEGMDFPNRTSFVDFVRARSISLTILCSATIITGTIMCM